MSMPADEIRLLQAREGNQIVRLAQFRQDATDNNGEKRISGIGAPYNSWTTLHSSSNMVVREKYSPFCFRESLRDKENDIKCCRNHLRQDILGRLSNATLTLNDTERGLEYSVLLNDDDPEAMRIYSQVLRGDICGASTTFFVEKMDTKESKEGRVYVYEDTIVKARLLEVGPVTDPAYDDTSATTHMRESVEAEYNALLRKLDLS